MIKKLLVRTIYKLFGMMERIHHFEKVRRYNKGFANVDGYFSMGKPCHIIGERYMCIGRECVALPDVRIECIDEYEGITYQPHLVVGNNVILNFRCHIGVINRIEIGDNVLIGSNVLITDHSHGRLERSNIPFRSRQLISKGPVIIKNNVWICENACILSGVTVGEGSIVAANAVVDKDVPPYTLVAGVPAKIVRCI